jgi:hypothetical protein
MNSTDIAHSRLYSQQIAATKFKKAKDIVSWMGAMQAQDYNMCKWAVGIRLPGGTEKTIEAAIHKGEIIRTHVLRPTWHLVAAEDIHWMLALSAPKLKASLKGRHQQLELTDAIRKKSNSVIEKALTKHGHLTRDELVKELQRAKIAVDDNRSSHLLFWAEMEQLICSGCLKEKEPTYTLLNEWVTKKKEFTKEEAAAQLAYTYFTSHGPATLPDFVWWSGLNITDARKGLAAVTNKLHEEKIAGQSYFMSGSFVMPPAQEASVYFLPAFDEYIISYKDRTAIVTPAHQKKTIFENGLFRPTIIVNGQATGTWKRTVQKDKTIVGVQFFKPAPKSLQALIKKAAAAYGGFLGQPIEMKKDVIV